MALEIQLSDRFTVRHVARDSHIFNVIKLRCPGCGIYADVDDDQWRGRVSVECATPGCTFHETHNFALLEAQAWTDGDGGGPYVESYPINPKT
jgi:hypothetical protein